MSGDLQRIGNLETILRPGKIVGEKYRVDKLIAEGGMAAVWAGVNERTGKRVALKVILRSFAAIGEAAELFRREALAASKVNHPNVVNIFDVIDHEGMPCIVMELLDGETLDKYLARNGTLSLEETMTLLLPAMRGVAAANAQGVVHRDLKPGNIFLCSDADGRLLTTKVVDFGIATMMERTGEKSKGTVVMAQFGTPAYMAPEAIQSFPGIDGRTDIYGFGVIIFQALTGQLPFPGEAGTELLARIVTEPPPKVTVYRPDLPAEAVSIIDCALAKEPNDRFPDMEHLIRAIEDRLLPPSPLQRALTPMTGVVQRLWVEPDSGPTVIAAQPGGEREPSGRVHPSETRVLFGLAGSPMYSREAASRHNSTMEPITTQETWRELPRLPRQFIRQRPAIAAAIFLVLIATAWLGLSRKSSRGLGTGQSATVPIQRPELTSLPSTPASAPVQLPPPQPEVVEPAESVMASEAVASDRQPSQARGTVAKTRPSLGAPRSTIGAAAPLASPRVDRAQAVRGGQRKGNSPNRASAPRAGRLSPNDF